MHAVLELITNPDPCSLLCLIALLTWVGNAMTGGRGTFHTWGYRIAATTFIAYGVYGAVAFSPTTAHALLWTAIRALLAAGLSLGLSWISLVACHFLVGVPAGFLERWRRTTRQRLTEQRAIAETAESLLRRRADNERLALQRQREQETAEVLDREKADVRRRRDDARIRCETLYHLYEPELEHRFPSSSFDQFHRTYLGDDRSAEDVEKRAQQIEELIQQHLSKVHVPEPQQAFRSMADVTAWYEKQLAQIEAIQDERLRATTVARLKTKFADLLQQCGEYNE